MVYSVAWDPGKMREGRLSAGREEIEDCWTDGAVLMDRALLDSLQKVKVRQK